MLGKTTKANLRSVDFDDSDQSIWALKGEPGEIFHYNLDITEASGSITANGANQSEAKSTISAGSHALLAALNEGGAKIICKSTGAEITSIPQETLPNIDSEKTVTNAATMESGYLFTASGEAGAVMYTVTTTNSGSCNDRTLTKQGSIDFGESISANHVFLNRNYLFVASGLGGLKIIHIERNDNSDTNLDSDQDGNREDDQIICRLGSTTLSLPPSAIAAHLAHGDTEGACN